MMRLNGKGYRIVAHVHDEVIIEAGPGDTVEEVCAVMGQCPPCADGLILRADGYECNTYRKD
jgi:DNA polymerase